MDVIAFWHSDGCIEPMMICLIDGRTFYIDEVLRNAVKCDCFRVDLLVFRYVVRVGTSFWHLYREDARETSGLVHRWYVNDLMYFM